VPLLVEKWQYFFDAFNSLSRDHSIKVNLDSDEKP
jgi:hypothetical protein